MNPGWLPQGWRMENTDRSYEGILYTNGNVNIIIEEDMHYKNWDVFAGPVGPYKEETEHIGISLELALQKSHDLIDEIERGECAWI